MVLNHWISGLVTFIHIACAVIAIGGTFFLHVMLNRIAAKEGGLEPALQSTLARRWIRTVWHAIGGLVVTGGITLWNEEASHIYGKLQHTLFGIKMLFFLGFVTVLTMLTVNTPWTLARRKKLLTISVIFGFGIILMSTMLRRSY